MAMTAADLAALPPERRAKIIGYEAPARSRVEVITEDIVDAELAQLAKQVAENDAAAASPSAA